MNKKTRNVISVFLAVLMFMCVPFSALAAVNEVTAAASNNGGYNIYAEGRTDVAGGNVTFLLKKANGEIGYIDQLNVNADGMYYTKFKFGGNIDDYKSYIKHGSGAASSPDIAYAEKGGFSSYKIDVTGSAVDRLTPSEGDIVNVALAIKNKYGDSGKLSLTVAAYSSTNELLGAANADMTYDYYDVDANLKKCFDKFTVPAGTAKLKVFVWKSMVNLLPLTDSKSVKVGDTTFTDNGKGADDPWVVGFVGDSNTHHANWLPYMEHYYNTRYPDRNIKFLSKGISGDTASGAINRFNWDIFTGDRENLKQCDEITFMFAPNDASISLYAGNRDGSEEAHKNNPAKWEKINACIDNYEKAIQYCNENNIKINVVTYCAYDESNRFETEYASNVDDWFGLNWAEGEIAKGVRKLAEKYNLNLIDMYELTSEYSSSIRNNNPSVTKVFTGGDRLHMSDVGGYLFGYLMARSQDPNNEVARVEITAGGESNAYNAAINVTSNTAEGVEYTYKANALPIAVSSQYKKIKSDFGIDLSESVNREIIKVSGLNSGKYEVRFDGTAIGEYTSGELANGINIAENGLNPGQKQSLNSYNITANRIKYATDSEREIRYIAMVEQSIVGKLKLDTSKSYTTEEWLDFAQEAGYSSYKNYSTNKPKEQGFIKTFNQRYTEERELAKPASHSVSIVRVSDEPLTPAKLYLVSHSQCANYSESYWYPRSGWGQFVGELFDSNITVVNKARAGWSLKAFTIAPNGADKKYMKNADGVTDYATYMSNKDKLYNPENSVWANIKSDLKEGDYVVISHGINDYAQTSWDVKDESGNIVYSWAETIDEYKQTFRDVVADIKQKGAIPIIATDVSSVNQTLDQTSKNYYEATKEIAQELNVPFVDMYTPHREAYLLDINTFLNTNNITPALLKSCKEKGGTFGSYWLEGDNINTTDRVHLSVDGAKYVAKLFADGLKNTQSPLKRYLK